MRQTRSQKPAVALLQLGSEMHSALESAAQRSGHSKSEFVRLAVQGAIHAQDGYWERLLMDVFCSVPELLEAAADAGLVTKDEAKNIIRPMDVARSRLYTELDRIDGLPSIHWTPVEGEKVRSYQEVMRTRASRDELVRPEIDPLERLEKRFTELAAQRLREREKPEASLNGRKSRATGVAAHEEPKSLNEQAFGRRQPSPTKKTSRKRRSKSDPTAS